MFPLIPETAQEHKKRACLWSFWRACVDVIKPQAGALSYTMILMTSLEIGSPFQFTLKTGNNTQVDFLEFFVRMCENGYLGEGDVLVMDNCSIHVAEGIFDEFMNLAQASRVRIIFMPKYSPELNPCEVVFSKIKAYLRANRLNSNWDEEILFAMTLISVYDLFLMYMECVWLDFDKEIDE